MDGRSGRRRKEASLIIQTEIETSAASQAGPKSLAAQNGHPVKKKVPFRGGPEAFPVAVVLLATPERAAARLLPVSACNKGPSACRQSPRYSRVVCFTHTVAQTATTGKVWVYLCSRSIDCDDEDRREAPAGPEESFQLLRARGVASGRYRRA